jgi:hypothetical protein
MADRSKVAADKLNEEEDALVEAYKEHDGLNELERTASGHTSSASPLEIEPYTIKYQL